MGNDGAQTFAHGLGDIGAQGGGREIDLFDKRQIKCVDNRVFGKRQRNRRHDPEPRCLVPGA